MWVTVQHHTLIRADKLFGLVNEPTNLHLYTVCVNKNLASWHYSFFKFFCVSNSQ